MQRPLVPQTGSSPVQSSAGPQTVRSMHHSIHAWRNRRQPTIVTHDLNDDAGDPILRHLRHRRLFNAEDHVYSIQFNAPHNYNKDSREAVYSWMARWLQQASAAAHVSERPFTPERLSGTIPTPRE